MAEEGTMNSTNYMRSETLFLRKSLLRDGSGFLSLSWKLHHPALLPVPQVTFLTGIYGKEENLVVQSAWMNTSSVHMHVLFPVFLIN